MNSELDIENDIPKECKQILDKRVKEYESGEAKLIGWEDVKKRLFGKGNAKKIDQSDTV